MKREVIVPITDVSELEGLPEIAAPLRYPTDATLKKYGLSAFEYAQMFYGQQGKCAICKNPLKGRTNIDHQHGIRGWKKLPPEKRKTYVRGILCWTCNHLIVGRGVTSERLWEAHNYLRLYEVRITAEKLVAQEKELRPLYPGKKRVKRRDIRNTDKQ